MSTFDNKPLSLIERKKQQWAREKEELDQLYVPWGKKEFLRNHENDIESSSNVEKMLLTSNNDYLRKDCTSAYRRSSLPPLRKNQCNSSDRYEREMGGETSGYGSDNANTSPEYPQPPSWNQNGYESSSSRDDRPKWRHKKDSSEIFWEDKEICYENENSKSPPNWVKRGLQQDGEILVTNTSPAESPEQDYTEQERPLTSSTVSNNKTFIRGQNIRLDSAEMADRERKRQIALIHQEAIRQQLEERERKRTEERKRRILEEREEELRIERENQIEKQRQLHEQKLLQEKLERERKRKEAIQEAIEIAEKQAKIEKKKLRMMRQNINYNMDNDEIVINEAKSYDKVKFSNEINNNVVATVTTNLLSDENKKDICSDNCNDNITLPEIMPPKDEILNNNEENNFDLQSTFSSTNTETSTEIASDCKVETPLVTPQSETRAVFVQPMETLQFAQYAVLIPSSIGNSIPVAIPLVLSNETETPSARTENRILTPSQYRLKNRKVCDSSTQTEFNDYRVETETNREKYIREKLTNLDLNYEIRGRKERRSRSESIVEERPKWGANRPPTRYLKQSEKDPLYQRKKQRQKIRGNKYDDKNSSDDSQIGTPRWRKKGYVETRHTRPLWRKHDQIFARNIRLYQTECVPLESDKDHIYYEHKCCCMCKCTKNDYADNVDILQIEQNSPRVTVQYKSEVMQKSDRLPENINNNVNLGNNSEILDTLACLHNGLLLKQEQWDHSPRTPNLATSRNLEN